MRTRDKIVVARRFFCSEDRWGIQRLAYWYGLSELAVEDIIRWAMVNVKAWRKA